MQELLNRVIENLDEELGFRLASLADGEGSFCIHRTNKHKAGGGGFTCSFTVKMRAERLRSHGCTGGSIVSETASVYVEYHGQIAYPCEVLRSFGFMRRVLLPVKGDYYRLVWVPRWRVLDGF